MSERAGIEALRKELIQVLIATRDIELLRRALQVLKEGNGEEVDFGANGRSLSPSEYEALISRSQQQIENGEFVTVAELEEESKTWL